MREGRARELRYLLHTCDVCWMFRKTHSRKKISFVGWFAFTMDATPEAVLDRPKTISWKMHPSKVTCCRTAVFRWLPVKSRSIGTSLFLDFHRRSTDKMCKTNTCAGMAFSTYPEENTYHKNTVSEKNIPSVVQPQEVHGGVLENNSLDCYISSRFFAGSIKGIQHQYIRTIVPTRHHAPIRQCTAGSATNSYVGL